MSNGAKQNLAEQLRKRRESAQREGLDAIDGLGAIARGLSLAGTATALAENADGLKSQDFKMIVMGRFKNGKSTLINALMGGVTRPVNLGGAHGPMVVDDLPATAVLSQVTYAEAPFIKAWKMNGHAEPWTLAQYLRSSTLGPDDEENVRLFTDIRQFEIGFPARLCESKVTLFDSPGLDEHSVRSKITMDAVRRCDAALIVYGTRALMGAGELESDAAVRKDGAHVFVVVNLFDGRQVDDRLRAHVWNKYVRDHLQGPAWAGQDLAEYDIYFVNAKMAADARYSSAGGGEAAYQESGLAALEERLGRFLIDDRFQSHLRSFTKKAIDHSDAISQHISQLEAAATVDRDKFRAEWARQEPLMQELRKRPGRIPQIVERYQNAASIELTSGFTALVARIRRDLPEHLARVTLPTEDAKTFAVWHQKKLMSESVEEINSFITERISDWSKDEANAVMNKVADELVAEVSVEVAAIGREFDAINMALTGWDSETLGTPGNVHSMTERVTAAIAGLLFGDISAAVGGGAGGYRGALGGIVGAGAASWILIGVLGITSGIVFVPILAIAAIAAAIGGGVGLVDRIKKKALETAEEKLQVLPVDVNEQIKTGLTARFRVLETDVTALVTTFIDEQVASVEEQVRINQQQEADRDQTLRDLKRAEREVRRYRDALENTATIAQQA